MDEQIVRLLREAEMKDQPIRNLRKRHNSAEQNFRRWHNRLGSMDAADTTKSRLRRCLSRTSAGRGVGGY